MDKKPLRIKKIILIALPGIFIGFLLFIGFFSLTLPSVKDLKDQNPETTAVIEQRKKESRQRGQKLIIHQEWIEFHLIPQVLKDAVRVSEDVAFYDHKGIDYYELKESIKKNLKEGRSARGGSTITQQLAKNLFFSTKKSYLRKIGEFFIAKRLEKHLSKERIFFLYLNVIELGKGIFGVEAASQHFFKKSVSFLNLEECVRLAAVLPRPLRISPLSDSQYMQWRAELLLNRLKFYGHITEEEYGEHIAIFKDD